MSDTKRIRAIFHEAQVLAHSTVDMDEFGYGWLSAAMTALHDCTDLNLAREIYDAIGQVTVYGSDYDQFADLIEWDGEPAECTNF